MGGTEVAGGVGAPVIAAAVAGTGVFNGVAVGEAVAVAVALAVAVIDGVAVPVAEGEGEPPCSGGAPTPRAEATGVLPARPCSAVPPDTARPAATKRRRPLCNVESSRATRSPISPVFSTSSDAWVPKCLPLPAPVISSSYVMAQRSVTPRVSQAAQQEEVSVLKNSPSCDQSYMILQVMGLSGVTTQYRYSNGRLLSRKFGYRNVKNWRMLHFITTSCVKLTSHCSRKRYSGESVAPRRSSSLAGS